MNVHFKPNAVLVTSIINKYFSHTIYNIIILIINIIYTNNVKTHRYQCSGISTEIIGAAHIACGAGSM